MILKAVDDIASFKTKFANKFWVFRIKHPEFNELLMDILIEYTGYIVGGFLRDIVNGNESRDIDVILDMPQDLLVKHLNRTKLDYKINRMSGIKIVLSDCTADIWTLKNNWAFKNRLIKKNDEYIMDNIADGCFYNFDSIVLNLHKTNVNFRNYNQCVYSNRLDILRKNDIYKNRNPTIEANILRAFFLKKKYGLEFSENCVVYLAKKLLQLKSQNNNIIARLESVKIKYTKYSNLLDDRDLYYQIENIFQEFNTIYSKTLNENQQSLDL